jgi:hypothetical protein
MPTLKAIRTSTVELIESPHETNGFVNTVHIIEISFKFLGLLSIHLLSMNIYSRAKRRVVLHT